MINRKILLTALVALLLAGCAEKKKTLVEGFTEFDGFALGTTYHLVVNMPDTVGFRDDLEALFSEVMSSMSVYDPGSLLNRLNRNETDSVDRHIAYCIETAETVSRQSGGEYDITLKPVIEAWGFNAADAQAHPDIDSLMQIVGYQKIRVRNGRLVKDDPRVQIDLNSIAKGYTVDLLAELVERRGADDYMLEVGGEVVCRGPGRSGRGWRIGIDRPVEGNNVPGANLQVILTLTEGAMATSGNYRKFYTDSEGRKVVHTISGTTGMSMPGNLLSATAITDKCILADAYGTMMMALGLERAREFLEEHPEVLGYLVYSNEYGKFETYASPGLEKAISK